MSHVKYFFFDSFKAMPHVIYLLTGVSFLSEGEANICWRVFLTACAGLLDIISSIDLPGNSLDVNDIVFSWSGFKCIDVKTSLRAPPWFYQLNNSTLQMFILQKKRDSTIANKVQKSCTLSDLKERQLHKSQQAHGSSQTSQSVCHMRQI